MSLRADYLGFRIARYKFEAAQSTDRRLSGVQEILMAIKLVKFYVWESSFEEQIQDVSLCSRQLASLELKSLHDEAHALSKKCQKSDEFFQLELIIRV